MLLNKKDEKSACGVGFVVNRNGQRSHQLIKEALSALGCVEHRGACAADGITGDGAGIMTEIPFELFGYERGSIAVATLFMPQNPERRRLALRVFEETFAFVGLKILEYREVPIDMDGLGGEAKRSLPAITQAVIARPAHCRTDESFNKLLYLAKQTTRTKERNSGIIKEFFFTSLSTTTIVYKALTRADKLADFYLDLKNPAFKSRFALFHRRFSTNTRTSWDKAQPFRLIGHNGEINTIAGNRAWSYSREQALGLPIDELLTHDGISDSGSLNEMVEALKYRSSIPRVEDILAIMMPPADHQNAYYSFWSRAMEPWDGPAFISYSDGETIGARLDRNGFRPCRWVMTNENFYLSSEAGSFAIDEATVERKGTLNAGSSVTVEIQSGVVHFEDPSESRENIDANFDTRLKKLDFVSQSQNASQLHKKVLFGYTTEDMDRILIPMITEGKEPIGSMGDTARLAIFSAEPRSFFDYFFHDFAQVTNPPLDYLREKMVTDLTTHLGRRPNIFSPKELIPPVAGIELSSPLLSLGQFEQLIASQHAGALPLVINTTFRREHGRVGFRAALKRIEKETITAVQGGITVVIFSDAEADYDNPPIPSLLAVRIAANALNREGTSLHASIVVHTGEVRTTHHVASLIGFGASAVCPYLALEIARHDETKVLLEIHPDTKEKNLLKCLEMGLLKIMSKMGISVVRSYQSSQLFTAIGVGREVIEEFFPRLKSPIGGIGLDILAEDILRNTERAKDVSAETKLLNTYQFKEHIKGTVGEKHSMTIARSKVIHQLVKEKGLSLHSMETFDEYLKLGEQDVPITIRHLLRYKDRAVELDAAQIQPKEEILKTFGSGAMSFGAISAESQRDIFKAMKQIGGRSNSGEGGENPYYYIDGTTGSIKQIASGRFGVTAEYLVSAHEFQIKIAQGAKPGEGGQLMGVKVNPDIARARHSNPNVDLISPPPLHDIYSIEDLKELIYELKQFKPEAKVNVKLVAGANIGTIAVGVVKAGADVVHISGHDGGTGAASLSSMKHAGLPWELGLVEVHQALLANDLRHSVTLRVDGGLSSGRDIVTASMLGGDEFEFGKLLLVSQGCVMARVCEKNTCPTGIATHNPKFKAKYSGTPEGIVALLEVLAEDVRRELLKVGFRSLQESRGRFDHLEMNPEFDTLVEQRGIDFSLLLSGSLTKENPRGSLYSIEQNALNKTIIEESEAGGNLTFAITTQDRAIPAALSAKRAEAVHRARMMALSAGEKDTYGMHLSPGKPLSLAFTGSAGQGFAVFLNEGISIRLHGEANDSVAKGMSGGRVVITPHADAVFDPSVNSIIGNCALYGATGGVLHIYGLAGDRFAVRNSGAISVLEGAGLHACEYMTNGTVVILGEVSKNVGAGMTGGTVYIRSENERMLNREYVTGLPLSNSDTEELRLLVESYMQDTQSRTAETLLAHWDAIGQQFIKVVPKKIAEELITMPSVSTEAA